MKVIFLACFRFSVSQKKKKAAAIEGMRRVRSGKENREDAGRTAPLSFPDPTRPPLFFLPDPADRELETDRIFSICIVIPLLLVLALVVVFAPTKSN